MSSTLELVAMNMASLLARYLLTNLSLLLPDNMPSTLWSTSSGLAGPRTGIWGLVSWSTAS